MKEVAIHTWKLFGQALKQKRVRQFLYIAIILVSLTFIGVVIRANWTQLNEQAWHIEIIYIILAIFLYPVGMLPTIGAWHWLLKAFNIQKPFKLNLRLYAQSSLPRHIPGLVWYVASRTILYEEYSVRPAYVISATAIETGMLAISGFISALLIIPVQTNILAQIKIIQYLVPIAVLLLVLFFFIAPKGTQLLDKFLRRWQNDMASIQVDRSRLWVSLGWMFVAWIGGGLLLWILVRAITPIGLNLLPLMVGIWGFAGGVSLTIGIGIQGLGLREVTLGALLSTILTPVEAITAAIAFRLVLTIGELLWVFIISIALRDRIKNSQKNYIS